MSEEFHSFGIFPEKKRKGRKEGGREGEGEEQGKEERKMKEIKYVET